MHTTNTYFAQANPADGFGPQIVFLLMGMLVFSSNTAGNQTLHQSLQRGCFGTEMAFLIID
jgi:hypothetical protein